MESSILLMGDVTYDARFSVCNKRNTQDIIIRRLTTSPFKSMYFQIFWQNYCRKTVEATTVKKVPNDRKLIYAIYNFIAASWCLLFSYCCTTTNLNGIFGDVNFSANGNREILKCMFTLSGTYLRTKIIIYFNVLLYIAILHLTSIPVNLFKKCTYYYCHGIGKCSV